MRHLAFLFASLTLLAGCLSPGSRLPVQGDLDGLDVTLLDADSSAVAFPEVLEGRTSVVGFVYTFCPDVCPMTTNTMRQVRTAVADSLAAQEQPPLYVTISFDPERDTPEVMDRYRRAYGLENAEWLFLTGDSASVAEVMAAFDVRYAVSDEGPPASTGSYLLNHSDQISLVDPDLRLRMEYGGSMTPPEIIAEDALYLTQPGS
jgi:protein SCO1/2